MNHLWQKKVDFTYEPKEICRNPHPNKFSPRKRGHLLNLFNWDAFRIGKFLGHLE